MPHALARGRTLSRVGSIETTPRTVLQHAAHKVMQGVSEKFGALVLLTHEEQGERSRVGTCIRLSPDEAVMRCVALAVDISVRSGISAEMTRCALREMIDARLAQFAREQREH